MLNYVQGGARLGYTNSSGSAIASGALQIITSGGGIGGINAGIAVDTIAASGGTGNLQIAGVFSLTKTSGEAYTFGENLYWNAGTSAVTSTASGNTWIGICADTAGDISAVTSVDVLLNGLPYSG